MDKREVADIIKYISDCYGNRFKVDDFRGLGESWYAILQDYEYEYIKNNLVAYVKTNRFAPSVADLVAVETKKDRAIPSSEETLQMLNNPDHRSIEEILKGEPPVTRPVASEEAAAKALAEIRKLLDIDRGDLK